VEWAEEHRVAIVPVRLDDSPMPEQFDNLIYADLRDLHLFEHEAMRTVYALTGNPVLRHLPRTTHTSLMVDWIHLSGDESQKTMQATLRIENRSARSIQGKALKFNTIAQWDFPDPGMDSTESALRLDGKRIPAIVRAALNSESVISLDAKVDPGNRCEINLHLYTDHTKGSGIGLNCFLIGCEVHMEDGLHATVRPMLLDLHGYRTEGFILGYLTDMQMAEAIEMAEEVERIVPHNCAMDDVLASDLQSLREKRGRS